MGVMYQPADDVAHLLIPFACAKGCDRSDAEITRLYRAESPGANRLGEAVAGAGSRRGRCCSPPGDSGGVHRHRRHGELLRCCAAAGIEVACISNDLAEWAVSKAQQFRLLDALVSWRSAPRWVQEAGGGDLRGVSGYGSRARALSIRGRSPRKCSCGGMLCDARRGLRAAFHRAGAAVCRRRQPLRIDRAAERDKPFT